MKPEIRTFPTLEAASLAAADLIEEVAAGAVAAKGFFTLVLAGGATPLRLYQLLGSPPYSSQPWQDFHIFWGDERCVAPDRPESNFAMAKGGLLDRIAIPAANVHRIRAELEPPTEAARTYEQELRDFFAPHPEQTAGGFPRFDLILLGMGADGHTASLFPGSENLQEHKKWAAAVASRGKPAVARVTMTLPVLNSAANVLFLIAGPEKRTILDQIAADPEAAAARFPAGRIRPQGRLFWFAAQEG